MLERLYKINSVNCRILSVNETVQLAMSPTEFCQKYTLEKGLVPKGKNLLMLCRYVGDDYVMVTASLGHKLGLRIFDYQRRSKLEYYKFQSMATAMYSGGDS